ncbi:hypothetical protein BGZ47_007622 [Haplosporangium gracile]|nr:hypothetical protein BGZ47_007622 [Haplosporangium gracile]
MKPSNAEASYRRQDSLCGWLCDVLVGADGAYSGVRQHLYKTLDNQDLLPQVGLQSMSKGYISLIRTADALDSSKYPRMEEAGCESLYFIGDGNTPYTTMMDESRHFKTTYGTLGDLFDATPMEHISKVYFEDNTGAGAVNAMQNAMILANRLCDIKHNSLEDGKTVLVDYKGALMPSRINTLNLT